MVEAYVPFITLHLQEYKKQNMDIKNIQLCSFVNLKKP